LRCEYMMIVLNLYGKKIHVETEEGVDHDGDYFDLAISRAALISGASVRRGSESLKNGCCRS